MEEFQIPTEFFLPRDDFVYALKTIASSAVIVGITHLFLLLILTTCNTSKPKSNQRSKDQVFKASYQITHLLVNLYFGIYALYICVIKQHSDDVLYGNILDKNTYRHIFGYEHYAIFGAVQVGYNLWSLPVGILYIKETLPMVAHHISVIVICSLTATSNFGFRLHAPFLLGMFEVSSVPLSLVNLLKDHKELLKKSAFMKNVNDLLKIVFSIAFLGIRIILGTPHVYHTIRGAYVVMMMEEGTGGINIVSRGWIFMVLVGQLVLFLLQLYWAYLILKGLAKIFSKKEKEKAT